ncbi:glycosyltransferase family 2 protein, partial [Nonomuraea sp. MCN248]
MTRPYVTVVVVSHDGARWLGETLRGLLGQSRRPDRVIGVDNGSRDGSAELLTQALGPGNVRALPRSASFGEAVADALSAAPATGDNEWIWLLHDDCAPDRRALEALLHAADQDRKATVLGPKLRDWLDRRRLLEIGVTVGLTGRRDTGLEPHEFDQGQHDGTREALSVSTAGMLIRRDVWEAAGGLDPFFPLFRDDLDLCWRVRNAGHRVLVVTDAVAWHAEAAARRRRRITVSGDHPRRLDRRNAIFVIMANLPFRIMLWALARNLVGSLVRTLLFLVGKQPANALDELVALGSILVHPLRLLRARRARRAGRKKGFARVRPLLTPRGAGLRRLVDMGRGFLNGDRPVESAGRHHHAAPADGTQDQEELPEDRGAVKRFLGRPGVLLVLALTLVTLVAERSLLGGGRLGGGALVPVTGDAADLWAFYTDGSSGWAPPYVAVVAGLSTLAFGQTWAVVSVLLLGTVPLAGASAYLATRRLPAFTRVAPQAPDPGRVSSSGSASDSGSASASGPSPVAGRATVSDLSTAGNLFSTAGLFSDAAPSSRSGEATGPAETPGSARTSDSSETPGSGGTSGTGGTWSSRAGGMRARGGKRRRTGRHGRDANGPAEAESGVTPNSKTHAAGAEGFGGDDAGGDGSGVAGVAV